MSDGVALRINVFRPDHVASVVMSMTPYGKDKTPDRIGAVEIWPSSAQFEAGSEPVVEIVGHDADRHPVLRHKAGINRGTHTIHSGVATPSALVVPLIAVPTKVPDR